MLRRTLLAFTGFCLLVLGLIVGYAAFGLSGPGTAVAEAERHLAAGELTAAITRLDLAEQELDSRGDPALLERILRLRLQAWTRSGNWARALADTERLLAEHVPGDAALTLDRIWLLLREARAEDGLRAARTFLDRNPGNGRALELAGEANQQLYQDDVRRLIAELATKLPTDAHARAVAGLRPFLFTGGDDPLGRRGKEQFDAVLQRHCPADAASGRYEQRLRPLRGRIQQAQADFAAALAAPGHQPVSAYRGLAFALSQGRRSDDLIALSEIYLRRFDHLHTIEAAANLTRAHLEAGRNAAVVEVAERFLPPGSMRERLDAGELSQAVMPLLLDQAMALHRLREVDRLARLLEEVKKLGDPQGDPQGRQPRLQVWPDVHLGWGLACDLWQNWPELEAHLGSWQRVQENRMPAAEGAMDRYVVVSKLRLRASLARGDDQARTLAIFADWIAARPEAMEPLLWRACYHLERGDGAAAYADARVAFSRSVHDEHALLVLAAAADASLRVVGRDAVALLDHCRASNVLLPSAEYIADQALYVALAQLALRREARPIARASARRAAELFAWARTPRLIAAEAALALGDAGDALETLDVLAGHHPDDPRGLALRRQAMASLGRDTTPILFDVARRQPESAWPLTLQGLLAREFEPGAPAGTDLLLTIELMQRALARDEVESSARIAERAGRDHAADPRLVLQVAETEARLGQVAEARRLYRAVYDATLASDPRTAARAGARLLLLSAADTPVSELSELVAALQALQRERPAECHQLAAQLSAAGHPELAYDVLRPLLVESERSGRTGSSFLLGGQLALQLGELRAAERYLTAALAFADGSEASPPLALLLRRERRPAEAAEALLIAHPRDISEAALFLLLRRPVPAEPWIREAAGREPASLPLQALLAVLEPTQMPDPDLRRLATEQADLLLTQLACSGIRGFAPAGVEVAERLVELMAESRSARFLHARALAAARRYDEAITRLNQLLEQQPEFVPAYDELVRLLQQTGNPQLVDPQFADRLLSVVAKAGALASPRLLAQTGRDLAIRLLRQGASQQALSVLAQIWVQHPEAAQAGITEIAALVIAGRREQAMQVLEALGTRWPQESLARYHDIYFAAAPQFLAGAPELAERIRARAEEAYAKDGAYGAVVHYLLDDDENRHGALAGRRDQAADQRLERARAMVNAQIDLFLRGRDPSRLHVVRSLERLGGYDGEAAAIARATEILRRDPSLFELWILRARMLERTGATADAERDLRWINQYLAEPNALFELARVTATAGRYDQETESRLVRELTPELAATPAAQLALGLLGLRGADYGRASRLLDGAQALPDGGHLYFRMLANLALPGPEPAGIALDLLDRLQRGYASSSLALNAGQFASQLALP